WCACRRTAPTPSPWSTRTTARASSCACRSARARRRKVTVRQSEVGDAPRAADPLQRQHGVLARLVAAVLHRHVVGAVRAVALDAHLAPRVEHRRALLVAAG